MKVLRSTKIYDLEKMKQDLETALSITSFEKGHLKHSISILGEEMVCESYKDSRLNLPFTNVIQSCPYFREIYDSIKAEILTMRLLRRSGRSSYHIHSDWAVGNATPTRFQIPITSNPNAYLCLSDMVQEKGTVLRTPNFRYIDEFFDYTSAKGLSFKSFGLTPGMLHFFDVTRLHTVVNGDETERVTLVIEVERNQWFDEWIKGFETIQPINAV